MQASLTDKPNNALDDFILPDLDRPLYDPTPSVGSILDGFFPTERLDVEREGGRGEGKGEAEDEAEEELTGEFEGLTAWRGEEGAEGGEPAGGGHDRPR
jgi:hypothetical protein